MADKSVSTESLGSVEQKQYKGQKLRVAIIGCGGIAQTHLGIYKNLPEVEVVAGVDIVPARLDVMRDKWGVQDVYTDWKEMLKRVKPDAVDVCTPNGVHAPAAIAAAEAGKNVFCEKPMAMNAKDGQAMADAAKRNGVKFVMGFQHRYEPRSFAIREQIEAGRFAHRGDVRLREDTDRSRRHHTGEGRDRSLERGRTNRGVHARASRAAVGAIPSASRPVSGS